MKLQQRLQRAASPAARQQVTRFVGKGIWAIMDQGLFAVSNFALNVLLARWLEPTDYGAFVTAFAAFLLLSGFQNSLVIEPMFVFGAGKYSSTFSVYLKHVVALHWALAFLLGIPSVLLGLIYRYGWFVFSPSAALSSSFLAISISTPFILFFWTMRRACYAQVLPRLAFAGSAAYFFLMVGGLVLVEASTSFSVWAALGVMAGANFFAGSWLFFILSRGSRSHACLPWRALLSAHWKYGRWVIATSIASWVPGNLFYLILPALAGFEASGALRALMIVIMPVANFNTALASLLTPTFVKRKGSRRIGSYVISSAIAFAVVGFGYWVLLIALGRNITYLLYGSRYVEYAHLLVVLGLLPVLSGSLNALTSAMRAFERPDLEFRSYLVSAVVTLSAGLALVWAWKTDGAAIGFLVASLAAVVAAARLTRKLIESRT